MVNVVYRVTAGTLRLGGTVSRAVGKGEFEDLLLSLTAELGVDLGRFVQLSRPCRDARSTGLGMYRDWDLRLGTQQNAATTDTGVSDLALRFGEAALLLSSTGLYSTTRYSSSAAQYVPPYHKLQLLSLAP